MVDKEFYLLGAIIHWTMTLHNSLILGICCYKFSVKERVFFLFAEVKCFCEFRSEKIYNIGLENNSWAGFFSALYINQKYFNRLFTNILSVAAYNFLSSFNKYFDASVIEISELKKIVQQSPNSMPLLNDTPCKLFHSERNRWKSDGAKSGEYGKSKQCLKFSVVVHVTFYFNYLKVHNNQYN